MPHVPFQLEFSDDIVKIIQAAMNADGGQPELKKANSIVKSFFVRVSRPPPPAVHPALCTSSVSAGTPAQEGAQALAWQTPESIMNGLWLWVCWVLGDLSKCIVRSLAKHFY